MKITFHPDVLKQLQRLPRDAFETVLQIIIGLAEQPRPTGVKKLVGANNDWRVRFGQYRIVYHIDDADAVVTIFTVGKRSDVYR
ncbi:MAG: type II toxin-antitoxin system RelE/ParE family toxin [Mycobacterium sp.]